MSILFHALDAQQVSMPQAIAEAHATYPHYVGTQEHPAGVLNLDLSLVMTAFMSRACL